MKKQTTYLKIYFDLCLYQSILFSYIYIHTYIHIYIYQERKTETEKQEKESTNKANGKEVWFDFHIRYRGENIAKGSPPFSKN